MICNRRQAFSTLLAVVGAGAYRPAPLLAAPLSNTERAGALKYLAETRDALLAGVAGLSPQQWAFKPEPAVWSAAEIIEHVIVVEEAQLKLIASAVTRLPALDPVDRPAVKDQVIEMVTTNRETRRFQSPEVFRPTARWRTTAALVEALTSARRATTTYVETTEHDLRSVAWENPLVGLTDGYQWILFVSAHCERHTKQLTELKSHPRFPRN